MKGVAEVEVVGWHHWLNGHEFEPALGDGEGQESLACCNPWDCKELDMTEWLNNNKKEIYNYHVRDYNAIFEMLLLLSILFFRFTCSVVPVACIFFNYYYYWWILFQCMGIAHFFFSISLPVDRHSDCSQFGTIVNVLLWALQIQILCMKVSFHLDEWPIFIGWIANKGIFVSEVCF